MDDLFEYIKWRGDISFSQVSLTPVDALIFSALVYIGFDGIVPSDFDHPIPLHVAADAFLALPEEQRTYRVKQDLKLLKAAADAPRFRGAELIFYRNLFIPEEETQFAAMTFLLEDGSAFLAFRGTDYSLVGWKEDFNMSFQDSIPAQREALTYTREFAAGWPVLIRLGGHSKGGNLAVYAAAKADPAVQERILGVYNNDGPGFTESLMGDPGYLAMVPKIHTYVPQSSIIGILLEHEEPYSVIKSNLVSILQHELYSWVIQGGDFVHVEEISDGSRFLDQTIKHWIADLSREERSDFVETLFELLGTGGADQLSDLFNPKNIGALLKTLGNDEKARRILSGELNNFMKAAYETLQRFSK